LPHTVLAVMNANMVRADRRRGRTANRVTESVTSAVVPGGAAAGQMMRWRGSIGRRFTQPRFVARNPTIVRGCADLAISAPNPKSNMVGVSADLAKSPDNSGLSALATAGEVGLEISNPKLLATCDYAAPH
jgi:hypothetical protein